MSWHQITGLYQEAFRFCFSRRLFLFAYPTVALCLIIMAVYLFITRQATGFSQLLFSFFPITICCGLLTIMATKLMHSTQGKEDTLRKGPLPTKLLLATQLPMVAALLCYTAILLVFGLFFLLKHIPFIGFVMSLFSFPALLVLVMSLLLLLLLLAFSLFIAPPFLAEIKDLTIPYAFGYFRQIKDRAVEYMVYFALALLPFIVAMCFNVLCVSIISHAGSSVSSFSNYLMASLFISALLTPSIVFFFYFSQHVRSMLQPLKRA